MRPSPKYPAKHRRNLLITVDGAGASHGLIDHITALNGKPGRRVHYSVGWDLGERERIAIGRVPRTAWQAVLDHAGHPRPPAEAGVVELTGLLREHPAGDQLVNWPADVRIISPPREAASRCAAVAVRGGRRVALSAVGHQHLGRHRPVPGSPPPPAHPGRGPCALRQANRPGPPALRRDRDQPSLLHGRDHRHRPVRLVKLLASTDPLAKTEPKTLRYRLLHTAAHIVRGQRKRKIKIPAAWPWADPLARCLRAALALPPPAL